jgi:CMP/dCMP kinase
VIKYGDFDTQGDLFSMSKEISPALWAADLNPDGAGVPKVVTIDGPAGSGKSTVAKVAARELGWHYVTTGAIYRTLALMLVEAGITSADKRGIERFVSFLSERYRQDPRSGKVFLGDREVSNEIKTPRISEQASLIAADEHVRTKLLPVQRKVVLESNGAVVDGRDMGTVVFPDARLKIFLTASPEVRAQRRAQELVAMGQSVEFSELVKEITARDERDIGRKVAPLVPASDAVLIDSSGMEASAVVSAILKLCMERGLVHLGED